MLGLASATRATSSFCLPTNSISGRSPPSLSQSPLSSTQTSAALGWAASAADRSMESSATGGQVAEPQHPPGGLVNRLARYAARFHHFQQPCPVPGGRAGNLQVEAVVRGGVGALRAELVRHHDAFETPLLLEDVAE